MNNLYPLVVQNAVLPLYDVVRGTSRFKCGKVLDKTQWLSLREMKKVQLRNLRRLVNHAFETVPYYRRVFKERHLSPEDIREVGDLVKLPILTKAHLRRYFPDLISRSYLKQNLISSSSGGTGEQIRFYVTREQMSWEVAAEFRAYSWAGYRLGDPCVMFWGSPIDLVGLRSTVKRFTSYLEKVLVLNTYVVSDDVLRAYAETIRRFNPQIVRGYASSVYMMAKFMLKEGVRVANPRAVITSAETLLGFQRQVIEDALHCPVFDFYGSREIGAIAAECEEHRGYHMSAENMVVEFLRHNEQVGSDEDGIITVTNLRNFGMPLIRYDMNDVGRPSDETCGCGRGLPLMASIEGRISQFMAVYDKVRDCIIPVSTAAPGPFSLALTHVPLESYRIVQDRLDRIVIRAVKGEDLREEHIHAFVKHMRNILGAEVKIEFEFVEYLEPLPSGKRSVFTSRINSFEQSREE